MPPRSWKFRVEDILESIERIIRYTSGLDAEAFAQREIVVDAVLRHFTIIGEAARHVPEHVRVAYPGLPWADMQDMRNVLVHEYFGASVQTVWDTIEHDLPPLIPELRRILQENSRERP